MRDALPFMEALVRANPERLVGGDWPHPRMESEMPDVGHLYELFPRWTPDAATRARILVTNPVELYDFRGSRAAPQSAQPCKKKRVGRYTVRPAHRFGDLSWAYHQQRRQHLRPEWR